jgi:transposase
MSAIRPISDLQFGVASTEIGVIQAPGPGPRIMRYERTNFEWTAIRPFLPNKPRGVPRVNDRRVLNGIFWILRAGAPWRDQAGTRRRSISWPGRKRRECREPEAHPTLHGVVFVILCLDPRVQPSRASAQAQERVPARWPSSALRGPSPDRQAASSPRPAPAGILR